MACDKVYENKTWIDFKLQMLFKSFVIQLKKKL